MKDFSTKEAYKAHRNTLESEISKLNAIQMALKVLMNSEYGAL